MNCKRIIAFFQTDLNIGGIERSLVNVLNNMDFSKYDVYLFLGIKDSLYEKEIDSRVNIIYLKKMPSFYKLLPFNIVRLLYKEKCPFKVDVAVDFNSYSYQTCLPVIKTFAQKKVMLIHNDVEIKLKEEYKYRILHFLFKKKYNYFDTFIAVSNGALESFKRVHKLPNKNYMVIPNIIDTKYIKNHMNEEYNINIDKNKINICSLGRIVHQKGFDLLVNFIDENREYLDNYHFYIIGTGSEEDKIKGMIDKFNLNDLVTMTGKKNNPYAIMKDMDAFMLLSRYEGQGMVFMEAVSLDLDIIMPKHLEKYVDSISGTDDLLKSVLNIKKRKHKFNNLEKYNEDIIKKINSL